MELRVPPSLHRLVLSTWHQAPPGSPSYLTSPAWPLPLGSRGLGSICTKVSASVPNFSFLLPQQASLIEQELLLTRSTGLYAGMAS